MEAIYYMGGKTVSEIMTRHLQGIFYYEANRACEGAKFSDALM